MSTLVSSIESVKVGNPHTSERKTHRRQTNPGHEPKSPERANEQDETKKHEHKTTPYSQTLHNPDKPEKPTNTQTSKDHQLSENRSSTDTSGIR